MSTKIAYIVSVACVWAYATSKMSSSDVQKYLVQLAYGKTQRHTRKLYTLFSEENLFYLLGNSVPVTMGSVIAPTSRTATLAFQKRNRRINRLIAFGALTSASGLVLGNMATQRAVQKFSDLPDEKSLTTAIKLSHSTDVDDLYISLPRGKCEKTIKNNANPKCGDPFVEMLKYVLVIIWANSPSFTDTEWDAFDDAKKRYINKFEWADKKITVFNKISVNYSNIPINNNNIGVPLHFNYLLSDTSIIVNCLQIPCMKNSKTYRLYTIKAFHIKTDKIDKTDNPILIYGTLPLQFNVVGKLYQKNVHCQLKTLDYRDVDVVWSCWPKLSTCCKYDADASMYPPSNHTECLNQYVEDCKKAFINLLFIADKGNHDYLLILLPGAFLPHGGKYNPSVHAKEIEQ